MPPDSRISALRRMAGAAAAPGAPSPRGEAPMLERALAIAALRVADGLAGLGLAIGARVTRRLERDAAFDGLDARALCLLVDPEGHDSLVPSAASAEAVAARTGLLAFDPGLTDALVEVQTIGRVDGPARPPRRPTRIDAALAQPFARAVLDQLARQHAPGCEEPRPGTLRASSFVAGPASLGLILTAGQFLRLDLALRLGDGARAGALTLILPLDGAHSVAQTPGTPPDPEAAWKRTMHDAAMEARVRLEAVLPPMRLPLSRLMALKVGDLIPLDPAALADVTLHGGASGVTMAGRKRLPRNASLKARLGQLNGVRAIKIAALPGEPIERAAEALDAPGFGAGEALASSAGPDVGPADAATDLATRAALEALPDLPDRA